MGWGPLGVSAGYRLALTVSMDAGVHDGGGRGSARRGALHDAQGTAIESLTKRSTRGSRPPAVGTEGSTSFLHAHAFSPT